MNEHPSRDRLRQLLCTPDALSSAETGDLTHHVEICAVCLETVEKLLGDPVLDRCRRLLNQNENWLYDSSTIGPIPPFPEQDRAASVCFPGAPTTEAPLGTLGPYAIKAEVGSGTFGLVFRAFDQRLNRTVAIKVLRPEYAPHKVFRARFVTEARSAAGVLVFDHVVQVFDVAPETNDTFPYPYLVMEWLEGETLKDRLAACNSLPAKEAVRIALEVAAGLGEIHRNITAHRDLKPSNIMLLADTGRAKIMDFGLALPANISADRRLTQHGHPLGTPEYMSPEQARGHDVLDGRSDIFSLGVVLYEMLTGRLPFEGKNILELLKAIAAEDVKPPSLRQLNRAVPRDLETIVLKCLAKEAAERYSTARALADDLRRQERGEPIAARRPPWWERSWKWTRRHKAASALLLVLFLVPCVLAAAGLFVGWREYDLRGQAERARFRADQERDRARDLEHGERVARARALARRGLWPEARRAYDEAVADSRPDADTLRVERVRCLFTYEERPKLPDELAKLADLKDLPDADMALVLLHRADYLLSDWDRQQEALKLVAQSLAITNGLFGADRAYAEGLAAPSADTACERFRAALSLDPFHHRANSALLTACLFLGRFDEARGRADFMRQAFRDDPLPAFSDAWSALLAGDRAACFRSLESVGRLVGEQREKDLRVFFTLIADMLDLTDQIDLEDNLGLALSLTRVGMKVSQLPGVTRRALEPFGFGVPTVTRLADSLQTLNWAVLDFYWDRDDAAFSKLEAANRTHPDALLLFVQAIVQVKRAVHKEKTDHAAAIRFVTEARDLAYKAADAPTILPRSSYRYQARLTGLMLDYALSQEASAADPTRASRMRDQSNRVVEEGRRMPQARRKFLSQGIEKNTLELECARFLVAAWLRDEPETATALRLMARLDLRAENWTAALRHADHVLRDHPNDSEMQHIRKDALAGLRKQLE